MGLEMNDVLGRGEKERQESDAMSGHEVGGCDEDDRARSGFSACQRHKSSWAARVLWETLSTKQVA